jgi:hypothetical protein
VSAGERSPASVRLFGSPSILVDGRDVAASQPSDALSCRVYLNSDMSGVPAMSDIVDALRPDESEKAPPEGPSLPTPTDALVP